MTEQKRLQPIPGQDRATLGAELYDLLAQRAQAYTMEDSTSIRVETAQALLGGVLYAVKLCPEEETGDLASRREAGEQAIRRLLRRGKLLLRQAQTMRPPVDNIACHDTLAALPMFFQKYDPAFFPQDIPCDIDYPLCHPLEKDVLGVEYVNDYLRRLIVENTFLRKFSAEKLRRLYRQRLGEAYDELLVNLYAPAAESALGCALGGVSPQKLFLTVSGRKAVCARIRGLSPNDGEGELEKAVETVCHALEIAGSAERAYLARVAAELLPRIRACVAAEEGAGIFAAE